MMSESIQPKFLLKQALVKENTNGFDLATLEGDTYVIIREYLVTLSGEDRIIMSSLFNQLTLKRKAKILALASSLNLDPDTRSKMTTEEREFFDKIALATVDFKRSVEVK